MSPRALAAREASPRRCPPPPLVGHPESVFPASPLAQAPDLDNAHCPGDLGTLEMNLNALDHIARTSQEQGVHSGRPRLLKEIAEQAIADGHGSRNYLAVYEILKKAARSR